MNRSIKKTATALLGSLIMLGCTKVNDVSNNGNGNTTTPIKPNTVTTIIDTKKYVMDVTTNSGLIPTSLSMYDAPNHKIAQYNMRQGGGLKINCYIYAGNPLPDSITHTPNKTIFEMIASNTVTITKESNNVNVADSVWKYGAGSGSTFEINKGGVTNPQAMNYLSQLGSIEAVRVQ